MMTDMLFCAENLVRLSPYECRNTEPRGRLPLPILGPRRQYPNSAQDRDHDLQEG
jgi:hypothetical protein